MVVVSVAATSTSSFLSRQRYNFYANGRHWLFYSDGTNGMYTSSTDGETWEDPAIFRAGFSTTGAINVQLYGTYFHVIGLISPNFYYRRGTPNADGSITWSADEQTIDSEVTTAAEWGFAVSTDGYVFISYRGYISPNYYPTVIKNANTDGTWSTDSAGGYPLTLLATSDSTWVVKIVPKLNGAVYVVYGRTGQDLRGNNYNGSTWDGDEQATSTGFLSTGYRYVVASDGDTVHLVWDNQVSTYYCYHRARTTSWGTENDLGNKGSSGYNYYHAIGTDPTTHDVYVFMQSYPTADHIYYKKWTSADGWDASWTDWYTHGEATSTSNFSCSRQVEDGAFDFVFRSGASPYSLNVAQLLAPTAPSGATIYIDYLKF